MREINARYDVWTYKSCVPKWLINQKLKEALYCGNVIAPQYETCCWFSRKKDRKYYLIDSLYILSITGFIPNNASEMLVAPRILVNCPTRWSLSLLFGFLCWSSISHRNIAQQCARLAQLVNWEAGSQPPWPLICHPFAYTIILGHYGSYLTHLEWIIQALALQSSAL